MVKYYIIEYNPEDCVMSTLGLSDQRCEKLANKDEDCETLELLYALPEWWKDLLEEMRLRDILRNLMLLPEFFAKYGSMRDARRTLTLKSKPIRLLEKALFIIALNKSAALTPFSGGNELLLFLQSHNFYTDIKLSDFKEILSGLWDLLYLFDYDIDKIVSFIPTIKHALPKENKENTTKTTKEEKTEMKKVNCFENVKKIYVNEEKKKVIVRFNDDRKETIMCSPDDEFDSVVGIALALMYSSFESKAACRKVINKLTEKVGAKKEIKTTKKKLKCVVTL